MGARAVGPWVGGQKPLGKSPLRGNPSPESTYLPTSSVYLLSVCTQGMNFQTSRDQATWRSEIRTYRYQEIQTSIREKWEMHGC